jgi:3D (Asp-Asp-Asp) domain-containing protein
MRKVILLLLMGLLLVSCKSEEVIWKSIEVTASAYNSVENQTSNQPNLGAWGDTLKPGMKCIAVSRDLLSIGIDHNTKVKITGLKGIYLVKDKMNQRWTNKIDIYMGDNIKEAREWGSKKVTIQYAISPD